MCVTICVLRGEEMIWALIFIIAFVVYLAVIRWNNIYSVIFSLAFFSMNILLFAYLLFIIKMSNYRYWFQAEYGLTN